MSIDASRPRSPEERDQTQQNLTLHLSIDFLHPISDPRQEEKTRQEILNDIISRSKERKLEKARGKEEQESERERLDDEMEELLGMLHQRPPKGVGRAAQSQSDDYDLAMRVRESRRRAYIAPIKVPRQTQSCGILYAVC